MPHGGGYQREGNCKPNFIGLDIFGEFQGGECLVFLTGVPTRRQVGPGENTLVYAPLGAPTVWLTDYDWRGSPFRFPPLLILSPLIGILIESLGCESGTRSSHNYLLPPTWW